VLASDSLLAHQPVPVRALTDDSAPLMGACLDGIGMFHRNIPAYVHASHGRVCVCMPTCQQELQEALDSLGVPGGEEGMPLPAMTFPEMALLCSPLLRVRGTDA
jgi:hypothetical protein